LLNWRKKMYSQDFLDLPFLFHNFLHNSQFYRYLLKELQQSSKKWQHLSLASFHKQVACCSVEWDQAHIWKPEILQPSIFYTAVPPSTHPTLMCPTPPLIWLHCQTLQDLLWRIKTNLHHMWKIYFTIAHIYQTSAIKKTTVLIFKSKMFIHKNNSTGTAKYIA